MKTLRIYSLVIASLFIANTSFSQEKTETIKVLGNCGMCETKIEKAAKEAGATSADWSADNKAITVKYNSSTTNAAKIQQAIAKVGYDTRDFRAADETYNNLHGCCKYEREGANVEKKSCCANCEMKDGKCVNEATCKDKDCCKDAAACKAKGCCSADKAKADGAKADCCKAEGAKTASHNAGGKSCCAAH